MSNEGQGDNILLTEGLVVTVTESGRSSAEAYRSTRKTQVLTILLTDLEDSTKQQSELGNIRAFEITAEHRRLFRELLADFDGQEVETAGDAFLCVFAAPSEGIRFALHMQARMRQARETTPELPQVRCGLHQGQIVVERHDASATGKAMDIYGLQISTTARITDLAGGGQILCTRNVGDDARAILRAADLAGLEEVTWRNHGSYGFKGVGDTYEVCEVGEGPSAPLAAPGVSSKSWPAGHSEAIPGWRPSTGETVPETNWRLEEKLGEGQFGEVWRAYNPSTKARQVFKFTFKRTQVSALKREARLLHRLKEYRHPALVEVYDVTEGERPLHYLEMEYVDGPTMAEWIATAPSLEARIDVIARIAEVLEVVHQAGIYHRDIKPANILLQRKDDGSIQPKLADFGVGAAEDADLLKTLYASKTDHRAGTWDYIAPELKSEALSDDGHRPKATPQSDLFALGLTLYQLVIGDLQALPGLEGKVPTQELREDIAACMADDPKQRPASGAALAQRLHQHAQRAQARRIQRLRRTATVAAAIATVIILLLSGIAFSSLNAARIAREAAEQAERDNQLIAEERDRADEQRELAEEQQRVAAEERERAEEERSEARRQLYFSSILQARAQLEAGRYDLARTALWQAPVEHSGWEWGFLVQLIDTTTHTLLEHYQGSVAFASFSPDGMRIVTASHDWHARVWDAATGTELFKLGHEGEVWTASFSPHGGRIVTASDDGTARVWDAESGLVLHILEGHEDAVQSALFSPDSISIVTVSDDRSARVWDAATGQEVHVLEGHEDLVSAAAFSSDGKRIITASWDDTARVWDAQTGQELYMLRGHENSVTSAYFSPDGSRIVTASWDYTARVWDAYTGSALHVLKGQNVVTSASFVYKPSASFSPDGARIVTASSDDTARVWDAATGVELHVLEGHEGSVESAAFSPDGSRIVTASWDGTARVWDADTGAALFLFKEHEYEINSAQFSSDSSRIVTASNDRTARVWNAVGGAALFLFKEHEYAINSAQFSSDSSRIVTVSSDFTARVWDGESGAELAVLRGHEGRVYSASFSSDGARIVTASSDDTARVWDGASGAELAVLRGHDGDEVISASFSPDGARIITASRDATARVWDGESGAELAVLRGHEGRVYSAEFSPDGARIVTASEDKTAQVWDAKTGTELAVLRGHVDGVKSASFSPDGARIITASRDATARVWDEESGAELAVLRGHDGDVTSAEFSPDGARIVTVSNDRTARVWDAASGSELAVLRGHVEGVISASFSPDGRRIVTASHDGTARIWMAAPWRLEDLPKVDGEFATPEEERKARFFEWKRQEYQRWMKTREADGDATHEP